MLLTVDVGNTDTVFGAFTQETLKASCRISTNPERTEFELDQLLSNWVSQNKLAFDSACYASVVSKVNRNLEGLFQHWNIPDFVSVKPSAPFLNFAFDNSAYPNIGADRIADAVAACNISESCLIADFGTAITFCLIIDNQYIGGVIAPGLNSTMNSLFSKTANLPEISFTNRSDVLSMNTNDSIVSGSYFGWRGLVREIIQEISQTEAFEKAKTPVQKIATGGIVESLNFLPDFFDIVDIHLTLKGLRKYHALKAGYE